MVMGMRSNVVRMSPVVLTYSRHRFQSEQKGMVVRNSEDAAEVGLGLPRLHGLFSFKPRRLLSL
jgi:hypothetical protein